jgi:hypothetical protein
MGARRSAFGKPLVGGRHHKWRPPPNVSPNNDDNNNNDNHGDNHDNDSDKATGKQ